MVYEKNRGFFGLICMFLLDVLFFAGYQVLIDHQDVNIRVTMTADKAQKIQIYYERSGGGFAEGNSATAAYETENEEQTLNFEVSTDITAIRLDFGEETSEITVSEIMISYKEQDICLTAGDLNEPIDQQDLQSIVMEDGIFIETDGEDPYLAWDISDYNVFQMVQEQNYFNNTEKQVILCAIMDLVVLLIIILCCRVYKKPGTDLTVKH